MGAIRSRNRNRRKQPLTVFLESHAGNGVGEIGENEKFEIEWRGKEGNHGAFASARENKNQFLLLLLLFMKQIHKGA